MAESQPEIDRPTEVESHEFAKALYQYIWQRFGISLTTDETYIPAVHTDNFQEIIGKAVICEQLMTRQYLKDVFNLKKDYMFDSDTAFMLCRVMCDCSPSWDFFKKLLRYSALIAEFFIYRTDFKTPLQLVKGPNLWNAIFRKYFAKDFYSKKGWEGLAEHCQRYVDVFSILEPVVERMVRYPYLGVYTDNYLEFPEDPNLPMTNGGDIMIEMEATFKNIDSFFNWKGRPGKPFRNRKESAIFECTDDESSGGSASHSSSGSHESSKDTIVDPLGEPPGLSSRLENLGQPSKTSTEESSEPSGEGASTSKEIQAEDQGKDLPEPEQLAEIESRKRPLLMDVSDNDGPTKAKQPKQSD